MTVNLFDMQDALDAESKEYQKLKKIRRRVLRKWGTAQDVIEGATNALESHSQLEAQRSSSPDESQ